MSIFFTLSLVKSKSVCIESTKLTSHSALIREEMTMIVHGKRPLPVNQKFHEHVANLIDISPKRQAEIAKELGYPNPNIVTMWKTGATKIPIEVVPGLARALNVDPGFLLRFAMREYVPKVLAAVEEILGDVVTQHERMILKELRIVTENLDPKMFKPKHFEALKQFGTELLA